MQCHYNVINFLQSPNKIHPIACLLGQEMYFVVQTQTYTLSLQWCIPYRVILDHVIRALDCMEGKVYTGIIGNWLIYQKEKKFNLNSLKSQAPGRFGDKKFRFFLSSFDDWQLALRCMSLSLTGKSTLVVVMAWCHQARSHYPSQCWPRSTMSYDIPRPEWVKWLRGHKHIKPIDFWAGHLGMSPGGHCWY